MRANIRKADVTSRRKVKPRDVVLGIVAVVLLLILAALVTNRAFAVNEPPELIIPQAPAHAASGLLIAPVPPEWSMCRRVAHEPQNKPPAAARQLWQM